MDAAEPFALVHPRTKRREEPRVREPPALLGGKPALLLPGSSLHRRTSMARLADGSVDHAVTDPPFNAHTHANQRPTVRGDALAAKRSLSFRPLTTRDRNAFAAEWKRLVRGWTVVFSDTESSHLWREAAVRVKLRYIRTLPWIHRGGTPQKTGDRPAQAHEDVLFFHGDGASTWFGAFAPEPYDFPVCGHASGEARVHETQKPIALMERILRDISQPGDLILDSCAGHATTLVAAVRLGRYAVGWERNRGIYRSALPRLGLAREQLPLAFGDLPG